MYSNIEKNSRNIAFRKIFRESTDRQLPPLVVRLFLYLYTENVTRVLWNGVSCKPFMVSNGVKQRAVISPILFSIYVDGLLMAQQNPGYGCYNYW